MSADILWAAPLLLLPGVALMVLSTSIRFGSLHDEFHRVLELGRSKRLPRLRHRARLMRMALVGLYISVALLAIASVVGTIANTAGSSLEPALHWLALGLTVLSVVIVAGAAGQLIWESAIMLSVIEGDEAPHDPAS